MSRAEQMRVVRDYLAHAKDQFRTALQTGMRAATLEGAEQFVPVALYNYHAMKALDKLISDVSARILKEERKANGPTGRNC